MSPPRPDSQRELGSVVVVTMGSVGGAGSSPVWLLHVLVSAHTCRLSLLLLLTQQVVMSSLLWAKPRRVVSLWPGGAFSNSHSFGRCLRGLPGCTWFNLSFKADLLGGSCVSVMAKCFKCLLPTRERGGSVLPQHFVSSAAWLPPQVPLTLVLVGLCCPGVGAHPGPRRLGPWGREARVQTFRNSDAIICNFGSFKNLHPMKLEKS